MLGLFTPTVTASVIYDFVCTPDTTCDNDPQFGGYFEFSDTAVTAGTFDASATNILSFFFESGDQGGLTWLYSGLLDPPTNITITLSGDKSFIDSIQDASGSIMQFNGTGGNILDIDEFTAGNSTVLDQNGTGPVDGRWVARTAVPESTTLALLGLGLVGIGFQRKRSKKAA